MITPTPDKPPGQPSRILEHETATLTKKPRMPMLQVQGIVIVCLLIVLVLSNLWQVFKPAPTWEYKIETIPDFNFEPSMNMSGKEGWELVFARRASSGAEGDAKPEFRYEMIFKRPAK